MLNFAFISRHQPTPDQIRIAADMGIELSAIGDCDAFEVGPDFVDDIGSFDGVIVVHPAAALRLASAFVVGIYKNANRAPIGEKPQFEAESLHLFDLMD